jgi:hypothetical protein
MSGERNGGVTDRIMRVVVVVVVKVEVEVAARTP